MEVALVSPNSLRIKTKQGVFVSNPFDLKTKTTADGVLLFSQDDVQKKLSLEQECVVMSGPGEYEIKSIKISGIGQTTVVAYTGKFEGIAVCISQSNLLAQAKDMATECTIVVLESNSTVDASVLAAFSPQVVILYGEKAMEQAKLLGKDVAPVGKYTITKDKLPAEMEVIVLG